MQCVTVKQGIECLFMNKGGCSFPTGECDAIVEQCDGCSHAIDVNGGTYCETYASPKSKWAFGTCNFATHVELPKAVEKKAVNPLKASKRAGRR